MPVRRFIRITTRFEGLHHWPAAPAPEDYLRSPHRHTFVVEADLEVLHDDREIEINTAARWLDRLVPTLAPPHAHRDSDTSPHEASPLNLGTQSCEQLATRIADALLDRHGRHRRLRCTVLEDGILGAGITWEPDPAAPA